MGILVTTSSLNQINACEGAHTYFTGSFNVSGSQWYSGSIYEAYFEEGVIYPYTCSNMNEVMAIMWACDNFLVTSSIHNQETNATIYYHKTR